MYMDSNQVFQIHSEVTLQVLPFTLGTFFHKGGYIFPKWGCVFQYLYFHSVIKNFILKLLSQ